MIVNMKLQKSFDEILKINQNDQNDESTPMK